MQTLFFLRRYVYVSLFPRPRANIHKSERPVCSLSLYTLPFNDFETIYMYRGVFTLLGREWKNKNVLGLQRWVFLFFFPPLFFYFTTPKKKDEGEKKKVDEALKKRMASRRDRRKSAMQSKFEEKKGVGK